MSIQKSTFGSIDGQPVEAFEIENGAIRATVITYAAALSHLFVPDREGRPADIVLGYDDVESYVRNRGSAGAICGRYANRIADATFTLDGQSYSLSTNEPPNHIHGGFAGFSKRIWRGEADTANNAVRLILNRPDGDEGYPGAVAASVTYRLTEDAALEIVMEATTDRATVMNMAYHGYWNLAGHDSGHIRDQLLLIDADRYTPVGPGKIPTGELASVAGTAFDFRSSRPIGAMIDDTTQLPEAGYDHNFCLDGDSGPLHRAARALDPVSGRRLRDLDKPAGRPVLHRQSFRQGSGHRKRRRPIREACRLRARDAELSERAEHFAFPLGRAASGRNLSPCDAHSVLRRGAIEPALISRPSSHIPAARPSRDRRAPKRSPHGPSLRPGADD